MTSIATRVAILVCVLVAVVSMPASASADDAVADLARDTPISAYGGAIAWSSYDATSKRYALVIRQGDVTAPAPVRAAPRAFDVSLGPDARGQIVALYTRCSTGGHGCDVYRYELRTRHERRLAAVSSPAFDEAWPAQWRDRIAFVRRARARVVYGDGYRIDRSGRGGLIACDVPFVKTLSARAASRRLDRSQCGTTTGVAIRDAAIVVVTDINQGGAGSESQVRLLRADGGRTRILARTTGGEGGYSPFSSPNLSRTAVWLTRSGARQQVVQGFLRIDIRSARLTTIGAGTYIAGRVARDERGTFWYVDGPEPDWDYDLEFPYCRSRLQPCRLVRASASPFSSTARALLPRLRIDGGESMQLTIPTGKPPVITGDLTRLVVRGGRLAGREPVPGVALDVLRTADVTQPGPLSPTGLSATTGADGRFSLTLPRPGTLALAVFAPALKVASIVVAVTT
jgi:hypothetical protein